MADRFSIVFLAVTVALATAAWLTDRRSDPRGGGAGGGDALSAILAVPVAIVSGLSRAAKLGILIKGGRAIEMLARVRALVIDKTGTLTVGQARIVATGHRSASPKDEVLRLAASLDQASKHIIAADHRRGRAGEGLELAVPTEVVGDAGRGHHGAGRRPRGDRRRPAFSSPARSVCHDSCRSAHDRPPGALAAAVAADGKLIGVLVLADELRAGTEQLLAGAAGLGIERIVLATGDRRDVARVRCRGPRARPGARGADPRSEDPGGAVGTQERPGDDDRRRRQRCAGAGRRRYRCWRWAPRARPRRPKPPTSCCWSIELDRVLPAIQIARRSRRIALESVYRRHRAFGRRHGGGGARHTCRRSKARCCRRSSTWR